MKTCLVTILSEPRFEFTVYGLDVHDVTTEVLSRIIRERGIPNASGDALVRPNLTHSRILRSRGPAYVRVADRAKHELAALGL